MADLMTAAEAAHRLGVKQTTLYAYVSRGVLFRRKAADGRGSLFDAGEVERLARRGRPRRQAGSADIVIESAITEIAGGELRYRGADVMDLAVRRSFEDVAAWLWAGQFPSGPSRSSASPSGPSPFAASPSAASPSGPPRAWRPQPDAVAAGQAAQAALPPGALLLERLQVIVPAMAATDPLRLQLDPPAVMAAGRNMIAGMVECLPGPPTGLGDAAAGTSAGPAHRDATGPADGDAIAGRLWSRLAGRRATPGLLRALSAALVLVADHELAASTLAARVAASVRADPYAVVATGLGAVSGALHGGASLGAETLLSAAAGPADVPPVIRDLLRRGERVPGFGHFVYRAGDPRAALLLDLVRAAAPRDGRLAVAEAVRGEVAARGLPGPNIDFALAVLTRVAGMPDGAGEAIFAVGRTVGWIAHAIEEYARATPLRPRAVYTGPGPTQAS
ncbi:MAG: citrate/2-methylcitrate synthase [Streptosporangiaceae bacterium]